MSKYVTFKPAGSIAGLHVLGGSTSNTIFGLKAYSKKQFDPFCRRSRIHYVYEQGKKFETTYTYNNAYINCLAAFEKGTSFLPVSAHLLTKTKRSN
jgi:hypothetical protein